MNLKKITINLATMVLISSSLLVPVTQVIAEEVPTADLGEHTVLSEGDQEGDNTSYGILPREENNLNSSLSEDEITQLTEIFSKQPNAKKEEDNTSTKAIDKTITSLTVKMTENKKARFDTTFTHNPNSDDPYVGDAVGDATIPIEGIIEGAFLDPGKAIGDYRKGNYGVRVLMQFPEGVDAKSFFKVADWEKSKLMTKLYAKIIGIPTPLELKFPMKWDKESVRYSNSKPNELSMVIRGMDKEQVSEAEWESYPQAINEMCIAASATTNIGALKGSGTGNIYLNMNEYTGNVDDFSDGKVLTKGKLPPNKTRKIEVKFFVADRSVLVAGGQGKGDISKAEVIIGKEYSNPADNNKMDTWREYLSPWDNENTFNTQLSGTPEIPGENYTLPGINIFERDLNLVTSQDGDFNKFTKTRFDRIVDYYDRANVTSGAVNDISEINLKHAPENIEYNKKTTVTYSGSLNYLDGSSRLLSPAKVKVDMKTQKPVVKWDGTPPPTSIVGTDLPLKGTFKGTDATEFVIHYKLDNGEWKIGKKFPNNNPGTDIKWDVNIAGLLLGGHSIQVKAIDSLNQESNIVTHDVTVVEENTSTGSIIANDYTIGNANITGTYTGDVARLRLYINGVSVSWGGLLENGKFTFYAANQQIGPNEKVTLNAYDKDDKLLQENVPVKIIASTATGTISPAEYTVGSTEIKGSYTGDVAKSRVTINGVAQSVGGSFSEGSFSYYIGSGKIKSGDNVTITAYDKNDKILDADKKVTIKEAQAQGTLTPSVYHVGETTIKGSYTGDIVRARVVINGETQTWGGDFSGGNFSYYLGSGKIKAGDTVRIIGYSAADTELDSKPVTVQP